MSPHCDFDLEDSNNNNKISHMTLWLMFHHHTKFGNKLFCDLENIIQQTFTDILNLCCDLELEQSNPIFQQDTTAYNAVL